MDTGPDSLISFGVFQVDRLSGELRKGGMRVRLPAQPFQVLLLLLDRAGEVVTRDELQQAIWPADTFVDFDRGLNRAVNRLRDALGDTAESPRFIETIPKRGYRFIAPVQKAPGRPAASPAASVVRDASWPRSIWFATAVILVAALAAAVYVLRPGAAEEGSAPSRVLLADFVNQTGDPAFDYTIPQALAVHLQQSPAIQIVSDHEVRRTLVLMRQPPDSPLTKTLAQDVCRRTGGRAVIGGTLSLVGSEYVLGVDVFDCESGDALPQQLKSARKEDVLTAVDTAAAEVRRVVGESSGSMRRFDTRVHRMLTTGSLAAFEAYTAGERNVLDQGGWSAVPFFRRTVEIDPEFAYAHAALGLVLGTLGEANAAARHSDQAYQLRDRVSEWERFFITAQYHDRVTGELDKLLSTCEMWVQTYPHDRTARNRLAAAYNQLGQPARALAELNKARELGRDHPLDVDLWAATSMRLGRAADALPVVQKMLAASPDRVPVRRTAYRLQFLAEDEQGMQTQIAWAERTPRAEALFAEQAATDASRGRAVQARRWLQRSVAAAVRNDFTGNAAIWTGLQAVREAMLGHSGEAREQAAAAVRLEENWETLALAAVALARTGGQDEARRLASRLSEVRPVGTLVQQYWLPAIRAQLDLQRGDAPAAIRSLKTAEPYELSDTRLSLLPAFLRAEAYLASGDGERAAAEFRKLLERNGAVGISVLGPLARFGLARALTVTRDVAGARREFDAFFESWRDADADSPVLRQARAQSQAAGSGHP